MKIPSVLKRILAWFAFTTAAINIIGHGIQWGTNFGQWYLPPMTALVAFFIIAFLMFIWSTWKDS